MSAEAVHALTAKRLAAAERARGTVGYADPPEKDPSAVAPSDELGDSWSPTNVGETVAGILAGTITRPTPTVLTRTDGKALLYSGKVNGIAGASNDGKSLIVQWACTEEVNDGRNVVYVDLEDDAASVVSRLLDMGVDPAVIVEHFTYITPDEPYSDAARAHLEAVVRDRQPTLVVLDSTGESLALDGAKPNDDDDVARWFRRLPTAIARLGPAVVVIDHMTKADDGSLSPIGSQRKRAAIGGAQYITAQVRPFSREGEGMIKLTCGKDRAGTYRRGQVVAEVTVTPDEGAITMTVAAPVTGDGASFRPTHLMEKVSRHLEDVGETLTRNAIKSEVTGNQQAIVTALSLLVEEGYVGRTTAGQAHLHRHLKP
ncbi:MAG TPA: AAA family ATPase, partial [Aquihabitans sp.]|nr:AAA family ATPase [Aquihabitans sp.]